MIKHPIMDILGISEKLLTNLFDYSWQWECEIIPAYMPPFPRKDTEPKCVIKWQSHLPSPTQVLWDRKTCEISDTLYRDGEWEVIKNTFQRDDSFMRYSKGPGTGSFWDIYGDDYHSPELAFSELLKVHGPSQSKSISTHGKIPYWIKEKYNYEQTTN